ncbi:MAG: hypothetical protein VYB32_08855 [Pseudomonadota bacterium]|nr:hypothetical protein [Pseudomonadota bacterium]
MIPDSADPSSRQDKRSPASLSPAGVLGRMARAEQKIAEVRAEIQRGVRQRPVDPAPLATEITRLDERVKHLPGKGFVVTATSTTIALIAAIVLFADKLRALVGG